MTLSLQASVATSSAPSAARTHVVTKGESLGRIAAHYYGSVDAWKKIYEANRNTISDPNKIFPGQKLVIP
ncbi:MAG: LysM peptidoglycan-binding domain-containing protein [Candidatus Hydrogenedentota bacterium]|nr:MAG: LysM peptidoglycan-binding domain-containing protein [Candidatus Hydrogenedentota bacterium]